MPPSDLAQLLAAVGVLLGSHSADELVVLPREELERREFAAYGQGWRDAAAQYLQRAEWADGLPAADAGDRTPGQAAVIPFRRRATHGAQDAAQRGGAGPAGPTRPGGPLEPAPPGGPLEPARPGGPVEPARPEEPLEPARPEEPLEPAPLSADTADRESVGPRPVLPGPAGVRPTDPMSAGSGVADRATDRAGVDPVPADGVRPGPLPPSRPAVSPLAPAFAPKSRRSKVPTIPRLPRPRRQGSPGGQE
ncbi:hypothetical protein ACWF9B_03520 [Streptomyces sp. NPDC055089]